MFDAFNRMDSQAPTNSVPDRIKKRSEPSDTSKRDTQKQQHNTREPHKSV
jgi:hypothetical protein